MRDSHFCLSVCVSVCLSFVLWFVVFAALCCTLVEPQKMLQRNEISVKTMQLEQRLQPTRPAHQIHFPFSRRVPGLARTCHFALLRATLEILDNRQTTTDRRIDRQTDTSSTTMTPSDGQATGLAWPGVGVIVLLVMQTAVGISNSHVFHVPSLVLGNIVVVFVVFRLPRHF